MVRVAGPRLGWLDERGDEFAEVMVLEIERIIAEVAPTVTDVDDLNVIRTLWTRSAQSVLLQYVSSAWSDSADDTYQQLVDAAQRVDQARPQHLLAALRRLQPNHPLALTAAIRIPKVVNRLAELFLEGALNRLVAIGDFIWNTARTQLLAGMQAGEGIAEIRDRVVVTTGLTEPRATAIARTEVVGASNMGSYMQMKATGLKAQKEWIATEDPRTRPTHRHVDGEWADIDEKFIVGGWPMAFPHDKDGPPSETVSCRCTLGWDIPEDEFFEEITASAEAFHMPGKHDQSDHGRKGPHKLKAGKAIKITHGLVHKKHDEGIAIAVTKNGDKKVVWNGKAYDLQSEQADGSWKTEKTAIKSKAYIAINEFASDWHEPEEDEEAVSEVAPEPAPVTPEPEPTSTPSSGGNKTYTPFQKAYVQSIFGSNGVKWHTDTKKIYDSALEVSQKDSSLSMADALDIMDQSLLKKTGDPFKTKMNKFLQTKAGMKYAQEKGGSAPVGSTKQAMPPTTVPTTKASVPKKLSKSTAGNLQKEMNAVNPPPWSDEERAALTFYTSSAYTAINKCLRGTGTCDESVLNTIKNIKSAMKPSTRAVQLFRKTNAATFGISHASGMDDLVGKTVRDKGVISTSISDGVWYGEIYLDIEAPVGSKMAWVQPISHHSTENEMVLAPGTDFDIVSSEPHPDYPNARVVKVRVVPGSSSP